MDTRIEKMLSSLEGAQHTETEVRNYLDKTLSDALLKNKRQFIYLPDLSPLCAEPEKYRMEMVALGYIIVGFGYYSSEKQNGNYLLVTKDNTVFSALPTTLVPIKAYSDFCREITEVILPKADINGCFVRADDFVPRNVEKELGVVIPLLTENLTKPCVINAEVIDVDGISYDDVNIVVHPDSMMPEGGDCEPLDYVALSRKAISFCGLYSLIYSDGEADRCLITKVHDIRPID